MALYRPTIRHPLTVATLQAHDCEVLHLISKQHPASMEQIYTLGKLRRTIYSGSISPVRALSMMLSPTPHDLPLP